MKRSSRTSWKSGGFTLAEALLAVVLLSIASAGILMPFTAGAMLRDEGSRRTIASRLASEQIEKVARTPFHEIAETWNDRREAQGELLDMDDNRISGASYEGFSRRTMCRYIYTGQQQGLGDPSLIQLTVQIEHRGVLATEFHKLIAE